jgi:lysophospholipase L1-like esterase
MNYVVWNKAKSLYRETQILRLYPSGSPEEMRAFQVCGDSASGTRTLLLGDSRISYWKPLPQNHGNCWINAGMPGATTAQLLLRVESYLSESRASVVVLQIGINDLKAIGVIPGQRDTIVSNCINNTKKIIEIVEKQKCQLLLMGIIKPGKPEILRKWAWSSAIIEAVNSVNTQLAELASDTIHYVDVNPCLSESDYIDKRFTDDCLHLNQAAYRLINQRLEGPIQELLAEFP